MPRKYPAIRPTPQTKDLPATQGMLYLVRTELKADINGLRSELKGEIAEVRTELKAEIASVRAELKAEIAGLRTELKAEIAEVRAELKAEIADLRTELKAETAALRGEITQLRHQMESGFEKFNSEITRLAVLIEEQNARNAVVLEGLTGLFQRQDRIEKRMDECEQTIRSIARAHRAKP